MARRNTYREDEVLETPFDYHHLLRAFVYIKKYLGPMIGAFVLSAIGGITGLFGPMITQKALDVAELKAGKSPRQPMRIMKYQPGCATELLCRCKYFQVERVLLNTEKAGRKTEMFSDDNSFMVLLCLSGAGRLGENEKLAFSKGDCVFIPASAGKIVLTGNAQILKIRS